MSTVNPFDLLGDVDIEDPSQLIAAVQHKVPAQPKKATAVTPQQPAAKLPSKPTPPAQAVREAKAEGGRGGGRGSGRGYGRGRGGPGFNRESTNTENAYGNRDFSGGRGPIEEGDSEKSNERRGGTGGPRPSFRGGRRGGFSNGEASEGGGEQQPRRPFERRSGTGRGNEMKREGSGRGNWGTATDELSEVVDEVVNEGEKIPSAEKTASVEVDTTEGNKDIIPATETEEKEPEAKEMTLEEYEKVLEEKRKALQSLKTEERKVDDKAFASMQQLTNKKSGDEIFIKLGSEKDKKKEVAEKEERAKKALSINEFLKPAEGERYYAPGGRGRGGRGRGSGRGGYGGENSTSYAEAPAIEDPGQFPSLKAK